MKWEVTKLQFSLVNSVSVLNTDTHTNTKKMLTILPSKTTIVLIKETSLSFNTAWAVQQTNCIRPPICSEVKLFKF